VHTTLAANEFLVAAVTGPFELGAYSNMTEVMHDWEVRYRDTSRFKLEAYSNISEETFREGVVDRGSYIELVSGVLGGYNANSDSCEDLTPSECTKLYSTDFVSDRRNLFLITKDSSNTMRNNTLLQIIEVWDLGVRPSNWMCGYDLADKPRVYLETSFTCNPSELTSNVARGLPWRVKLTTGDEVEISGCKSERTTEKCHVRFSLEIMIVVICCNLVKVFCMVMAVARSREPTLVTLGDAIDSFFENPGPNDNGDMLCRSRVHQEGVEA